MGKTKNRKRVNNNKTPKPMVSTNLPDPRERLYIDFTKYSKWTIQLLLRDTQII